MEIRRVTGTVTDVTDAAPPADPLTVSQGSPPQEGRETRGRQQKRDKERLRKQRKRARRAAALQQAALAEAARLEMEARDREARAEKLAPAVRREPVVAPAVKQTTWRDGRPETVLVGARVRIVDGRPVRAFGLTAEEDPVVNLAGKNKSITERHTAAARQLQLDWEDVGGGLGLGAVDYLRTGGGSGGGGVNAAMLAQAATRARLDGAMAHLGAFAPAIARIVLDCVPVYAWAAETTRPVEAAVAWLVCALDRLVGFYFPDHADADRPRPIRTLAPPRNAYAVAIGAPSDA